jgi:hypothetical protein
MRYRSRSLVADVGSARIVEARKECCVATRTYRRGQKRVNNGSWIEALRDRPDAVQPSRADAQLFQSQKAALERRGRDSFDQASFFTIRSLTGFFKTRPGARDRSSQLVVEHDMGGIGSRPNTAANRATVSASLPSDDVDDLPGVHVDEQRDVVLTALGRGLIDGDAP